MTRNIPFNGQITFPNYQASQLLYLGRKKYLIIAVALFVVSMSIIGSPNPTSPATLFSALAGLLTIPFIFFLIRSKWKKIYSQTPYFQFPISGEISVDGFTISSQRGTGTIPWCDITDLRANDKLFIVFQGPMMFHVFPLDFFGTPSDWSAAIELIRSSIKGSS